MAIDYIWEMHSIRDRKPVSKATGMPLVLMPHHVPLLTTAAARLTRFGYASVHGFAQLAVLPAGLSWRFTLPTVPVSFKAPRPPAARPALLAELAKEAAWMPPDNYLRGAGDPYNAGKFLSRMARTALIADALGERHLALSVAANLSTLVNTYAVSPASENTLLFDRSWGGVRGHRFELTLALRKTPIGLTDTGCKQTN